MRVAWPSGTASGGSLAAAPAVLGSSLLMLASVRLGRWAALFPLVWVASAAVLLTRVGERIVVRGAYRFRRPSPAQAVALQPRMGDCPTSDRNRRR